MVREATLRVVLGSRDSLSRIGLAYVGLDHQPVTPSPTRPHDQLTPNLYRFLGKQSIDPTDLIPQLEDLQAELASVLMENGVIKYRNKSGGATQSLIKIPVCSTDKVFC